MSDQHSITLSSSTTCMKCTYALSGLPVSGSCPECGLPIMASLEARLASAPPTYLARLRLGMMIFGVACALYLACQVIGVFLRFGTFSGFRAAGVTALLSGLSLLGTTISCILAYIGVAVALASPPMAVRRNVSPVFTGLALWGGAVWTVANLLILVPISIGTLGNERPDVPESLIYVAYIVTNVAFCPFVGGLAASLIGLARHARWPEIERRVTWRCCVAIGCYVTGLLVVPNALNSGMGRFGRDEGLFQAMFAIGAISIITGLCFAIAAARGVRIATRVR